MLKLTIRNTERLSLAGNPIIEIKQGDKWIVCEQLPDGNIEEYDESFNDISYTSVKEVDEGETEEVRTEVSKTLNKLSGNRFIGKHGYTTADNKDVKYAIVIWIKKYNQDTKKKEWKISFRNGLTDLTPDDIKAIVSIL